MIILTDNRNDKCPHWELNSRPSIGAEASWLWCWRRRSSSDFATHPSASLHPECSLVVVRPHRTRNSTVSCSPIVPTPRNLCVSIRVPCPSLLRHNSSNRARAGTGASCRTKMRSWFCRASLLETSSPCFYPSFSCSSSSVFSAEVLKPSCFDTM